ncbi:MAG: hypothetical protein Q9196_006322, partial [Gyalolechia fulgens]
MQQDFYNQSRTPQFYGGTITLVVVATIAVALRLLARSMSAAKLWWDDWILVLALVSLDRLFLHCGQSDIYIRQLFDYALSICYWLQAIHAGLGRHTTVVGGPVEPDEVVLYYKLLGAWIIVILYFLVDFFVAVFECKPVAFFWDKSIQGGTCIDQNQFFRWNGVANLLIDFMILTLTMPLIWRLNLKSRQKASLSAVFLLGTLYARCFPLHPKTEDRFVLLTVDLLQSACVASVVRVIAFNQVNFDDITYTIVDASIWSTIEQSVGIICASLLTYQPLFHRIFSKFRGFSDRLDSERTPPRAIGMLPWRSKSDARVSGDPGSAGFSRLNEKPCLENGVTTRVTAERV